MLIIMLGKNMKTMTTDKKTMTTAIIQYPLPAGAPIDAVKGGFLEVAPFFQRPMIKEKFHVEPSITYFETPVIVDNVSSQILS